MKKKTKIFLITISIAVVIAAFLFVQFSKASSSILKVWILDVGQGDSIFIKTPEGIDILIDGGKNRKVLEELGEILPFWDRYIDLVILTHPHADHVNGLVEVLKRYRVEKVLEPGFESKNEGYLTFSKLIEQKNIEKIIADNGQRVVLEDGIAFEIYHPNQPLDDYYDDLNDVSVVSRLSFSEIDFLFTGDVGVEIEKNILDENLSSEFLKVGHHGSRYSSGEEFLNLIHPLISVISLGENNSYGHPHREVIDRLEKAGSRVLRTDISGTIRVEVEEDGEWKIKCERRCY